MLGHLIDQIREMQNHAEQIFPLYSSSRTRRRLRSVADRRTSWRAETFTPRVPRIAAFFEQRLELVTDRLVRDGLNVCQQPAPNSGKPLWRIARDPAHFGIP